MILGTNHGTILGCQCSHATSVRGAYGLSTVGLVSRPYGDSRLILPTRDCDFVKSTRGLRAICFGQKLTFSG